MFRSVSSGSRLLQDVSIARLGRPNTKRWAPSFTRWQLGSRKFRATLGEDAGDVVMDGESSDPDAEGESESMDTPANPVPLASLPLPSRSVDRDNILLGIGAHGGQEPRSLRVAIVHPGRCLPLSPTYDFGEVSR